MKVYKEPTPTMLLFYPKSVLDTFFKNLKVGDKDIQLMEWLLEDITTSMVSKDELEEIVFLATMGNDKNDHNFITNHPELCEMCGWCCKNCDPIIVMPQEVPKIASMDNLEPLEYMGVDVFKMKTPCIYQLEDNRCSIYKDRPESCAVFPIFVKNGSLMVNRNINCKFVYNFLINKIVTMVKQVNKKRR